MTEITIPQFTSEIVLNNKQTQELNDFFFAIADELEFLQEVTGTGSPEGVVAAKQGKRYRDITGTASNIMYVKNLDDIAGDEKDGWILI